MRSSQDTTGTHRLQSGDSEARKRYMRRRLELSFDGPYQVTLTMPPSMKMKPKWVHASHCKKVNFQVSDANLHQKDKGAQED